MSAIFVPNAARIIHEEIDGEVIIIHSQTGTYYSLLDTAVTVWRMIVSGCTVDTMIDAVASAYKLPIEQTRKDIMEFIQQLYNETIIVEGVTQGQAITQDESVTQGEVIIPNIEDVQTAYSAPQLQIYADLQDLLTIDPIHDVDESGWPNARITSNDDT